MHPWWPHLFDWPRFLDPISWTWLSVKGYAFTSSGEQVSIPIGLAIFYWTHTCHVGRCLRPGRHRLADGKYVVCQHHLPGAPKRLTVAHIHAEHKRRDATKND